jgi:hypothetical protein
VQFCIQETELERDRKGAEAWKINGTLKKMDATLFK